MSDVSFFAGAHSWSEANGEGGEQKNFISVVVRRGNRDTGK